MNNQDIPIRVTFTRCLIALIEEVHYLEVSDRNTEDCVVLYPDDDLQAVIFKGSWQFTHKDGSPY